MDSGMDAGTYEVLRDRLTAQAGELARRAEALNAARVAEFGSTGLALAGTESIRTGSPRLARDVVCVAGRLLVGFEPGGPGTGEPDVSDVFALCDDELRALPHTAVPGLLDDPDFVHEFRSLHRYFQGARLLRLRLVDGRLLAVFRTGDRAEDIRVLRWALGTEGVRFLDARGERDHVTPPAHDFVWTDTTREDHVPGRHPHVSIDGTVFVTTVGGALILKSADDTETPDGFYREPVDEPLQSLADAEISHARIGPLLLLRVRPYKEENSRYLVVDPTAGTAERLDGIGRSCRRLPEDRGIVFPGGYCLADGTVKTFDIDTAHQEFERTLRSPNGEDLLFVHHARRTGLALLLPYNLIREEFGTPLLCRGYALFDDGTLVTLRSHTDEAAVVHPLQRWHSPFASEARAVPAGDGPLARIGNADLVRGISDCLAVARQAREAAPAQARYASLVAACSGTSDRHHWLGAPEAHDLRTPLDEVRATAAQVVEEFATVQTLIREAAEALDRSSADLARLVRRIRGEAPASAPEWMRRLTELRRWQGHLATLKDMRYADTAAIDALGTRAEAELLAVARRAVDFLGHEDAFAEQHAAIEGLADRSEAVATAAEAARLADQLGGQYEELRTLTEVVTDLDIGDATVRTAVLEQVGEVAGGLNRVRAALDTRRRALLEQEGRTEFAAELGLLGQSLTAALAAADSPDTCDTGLARLLTQLENLASRFADHDDFLAAIEEKSTEVQEAFRARKQVLQDALARKAARLAESAARVLATIARRSVALPDAEAVHTYFASDPMVTRVRTAADELRALGDRVQAEELTGRLKSARQEADRALRDRTELFSDDGGTVRLGRHRFAVNRQPAELTLIAREEGPVLLLTGTDYRVPVTDPGFAATRPYWDRLLPSESADVYRAEYLAARLLTEHGPEALPDAGLPDLVRAAMQSAHDEGYERGVHDHDTTEILRTLLRLWHGAGPLRHAPHDRARAQLFWAHTATAEDREQWERRALSLARAHAAFGHAPDLAGLRAELAARMDSPGAAAYLVDELTHEPAGFALSASAHALLDAFHEAVAGYAYEEDLAALTDLDARRRHVAGWLHSYTASLDAGTDDGDLAEAVAAELCPALERHHPKGEVTATVTGLRGSHRRVSGGNLVLRLDEFLDRTAKFAAEDAPAFRAYQQQRGALVAAERARLDVDAHRPRVMPAFVRNRLVDEVYLPLIGDNLARQLGAAGEDRRTDSNGLLLLVSPPGYGKTTLMEYVAERLGLLLVKVDGPALGSAVTSLDPDEAPNASARRELEKIAFALAAANNVLLYLDDIQHVSPEFLQKFIPLCDATRTLQGHDLRGKRFAVCMAGNPYTESGARFGIPDMLANRADVWNLGDVLTGKDDAFAMSFVENALTSHPVLAPLAARDRGELELLVCLAENDPTAVRDRLTHPYAAAELDRILAVLRHLLTARQTVLAVNAAYIASAGRRDDDRGEPPFRLQGSYRNMNKITARISPAMNEAELSALIDDHYRAEAQTLTADAEAALLKLAELRGTLTPEQAARWADIKRVYAARQTEPGSDAEQLARTVTALELLADRIEAVEAAIVRATDPRHPLSNPHARHAAREGHSPARGA